MDCEAHLLEKYLLTPTFGRFFVIFAVKWVTLTWVLACHRSSLEGVCKQDYKSLCPVVMICATNVDTKFDFYILIHVTSTSIYVKLEVSLSVHSREMHLRRKFDERRSVTCT